LNLLFVIYLVAIHYADMSDNSLEFSFTFDTAAATIRLTKNNDCVYLTKLETAYKTPQKTSPNQATCLDQIRNIIDRIGACPSSLIRNTFDHDNDQTLAHICAWTTADAQSFKQYSSGLTYNKVKLLEFARVCHLNHIIKMLQPQEKTIVMNSIRVNEFPYRISATVKHVDGVNTATFTINGVLTDEDLHSATEAISIIKDIISVQGQIHSRIEKLRRSATFDEAAFVYIAKLVKHTQLALISATVRPGSVNFLMTLLETMTFE
jgi:hypothetical protein